MMNYGRLFNVSIYGESHGEMVGVVIDGVKPGTVIDNDKLLSDLQKRKSGGIGTTKRIEADAPTIYSGVFNGKATGAPIHIGFLNTDTRSKDYSQFLKMPRPGHSDYSANCKYEGFQDYRGGGHFSGRITLGLVAAGAIAKMMLPFAFNTKLIQVGTLKDMSKLDEYLESITSDLDSIGGIIEINVSNIIKGLGEPFFESVESKISQILFSVPAVKGVEFGVGFNGVNMMGSEFNDCIIDESGKTKTNNNGGINGGITNGNDIICRVFIKPTPSIMKKQDTFDFSTNEMSSLEIKGRHDVCIAKRALIVCENAIAIALADLYLMGKQ